MNQALQKLDEKNQALLQLNELLKKSDYLNSILHAHREATGEAIAILMKALVAHDPAMATTIGEVMNDIAKPTGRPSIDGERSLIAQIVREQLQR